MLTEQQISSGPRGVRCSFDILVDPYGVRILQVTGKSRFTGVSRSSSEGNIPGAPHRRGLRRPPRPGETLSLNHGGHPEGDAVTLQDRAPGLAHGGRPTSRPSSSGLAGQRIRPRHDRPAG